MPGADMGWARTLAAPTAVCPGLALLSEPPANHPFLALTPERLELRLPAGGMHPLFVDFNESVVQRRVHAGRRDQMARALGLHRRPCQTILDATCGIGRDSAVLLGLGCTVSACERSPVMHALLRDGLRRARDAPPACEWLANWKGLEAADAAARLAAGAYPGVEAIYLDPMFRAPQRRALPGREMQMLHAAVGPDIDADELLAAARASGASRTVVKRHPRQLPLAPPDYSVDGRRVCFDVYGPA